MKTKPKQPKLSKPIGKGKFCDECAYHTMRYEYDLDATQSVYKCTKCNNRKAI